MTATALRRGLDALDVSSRAGLDVGGVRLVRVDVHGQREVRVHAHQHVAEDQFAVAGDPHAHDRFVAHPRTTTPRAYGSTRISAGSNRSPWVGTDGPVTR